MRHEPTAAEERLWQALRRHHTGAKFRRQHAIGQFIVDFYCSQARLVIEVNGLIHENTAEEDRAPQELVEHLGLRVLRFSNYQVLDDLDSVVKD